MKKYNILIALAGMLVVPGLHAAVSVGSSGQITLGYGPDYGTGGGGFAATGTSGDLVALGTFTTFCIEKNEYFHPGGTYNATLANGAVSGGVSGGNPDPVSMGTAWVYSQFRAGTLTVATPQLLSGQLQNAIWWLEGEITADQTTNPFIMALNTQQSRLGDI